MPALHGIRTSGPGVSLYPELLAPSVKHLLRSFPERSGDVATILRSQVASSPVERAETWTAAERPRGRINMLASNLRFEVAKSPTLMLVGFNTASRWMLKFEVSNGYA
jgi:hypothetical protein